MNRAIAQPKIYVVDMGTRDGIKARDLRMKVVDEFGKSETSLARIEVASWRSGAEWTVHGNYCDCFDFVEGAADSYREAKQDALRHIKFLGCGEGCPPSPAFSATSS